MSGPLPPPGVLQGYENVKPGSADRIMGWAERQGEHRRSCERRELWWANIKDLLGLVLSFGWAGFALWLGVGLLRDGYGLAGFVSLVGALVPFVIAFVTRRKQY